MSKMSELDIEIQEAKERETERVYIANDIRVTRDLFIMQLGLAIHNELERNAEFQITSFQEVVNEFIKGDSADTLTIDGKIFSSYLESSWEEQYPIKRFTVSYDINVIPSILKYSRGEKWKRVIIEMSGTSYAEVRKALRASFKELHPDRKIKAIKVEDLIETQTDGEDIQEDLKVEAPKVKDYGTVLQTPGEPADE